MKTGEVKKGTGWAVGLATFGLMMVAGAAFGGAAAVFENGLVTLSFDEAGRIASLKDRASGAELVAKAVPMVSVQTGGRTLEPASFAFGDGVLTYAFPEGKGELALRIIPFEGGWTFALERMTVENPQRITLGQVSPSCGKWVGFYANMFSTERFGVVLRGYSPEARMSATGSGLSVWTDCTRPYVGLRFGLAAGPRGRLTEALRAMTVAAGVPHSDKGGAWALGAPACRNSYLMAYGFGEQSADWWIELARRGGFGSIHLDNFQKTLGHYEPIPARFPNGLASLSNSVAKIRAAGFTADMHTLSDAISLNDPWISPEAPPDLVAVHRYTLAEPLAAGTNGTTLVVKEKPGPKHDIILSYIGNGNILQVGTELIQYSGISTNAPWTFTGVKRGAFGTTVKPHAPGDEVKYLWQHFIALFAEPESKLGADLYDNIGRIVAECGFDTVYLDGLDGLAPWMGRFYRATHGIYEACVRHGAHPLYEDSCWSSYQWWYLSRIGAWDYPRWAPKMFTDRHLNDIIRKSRQENLLEPQMGWWKIRGASVQSAIFRVDDHEYFFAKCAAADAASSIQLSRMDLGPKSFPAPGMFPFNDVRILTYMGWYERFRLAKAFSEKALAAMGEKGGDVRLRQDARGEWMLTPVAYDIAHVTAGDPSGWRVTSDADRKDVAMRFEALYTVAPFDDRKGETVFDPAAAESYRRETASKDVTLACTPAADAAHGPTLRIRGANAGASPRGAWARISRDVAHPYLNLFNIPSFGLWVKGDGSGALLNVQAQTPREWFVSYSDNYVTLDFTGWRYFAFPLRERNSEESVRYVWPYSDKLYPLCREVRMDHVSSVSLWLNEIPAGGSATVEVSAVRALPITKDELREPVVAVNGERHAIPFAFVPGEFAELEDGFWTKYDDQGNPLARARAATRPSLKAGANACAFSAVCADAAKSPRAEILFRKESAPMRALRNGLTADDERAVFFEAVEPVVYAPTRGLDTLGEVRMRPGRMADLSFRVYGPIDAFTLAVGGVSRDFPALKKGESARYDRAFKGLSGRQEIRIGTNGSAADARFEFEKNYTCLTK